MKNGRFKVAKGFVMGVVFMLMLSGTVLMASPQMREVILSIHLLSMDYYLQLDLYFLHLILIGLRLVTMNMLLL